MKKITICFAVAFSMINIAFISEIYSQTLGFSECLDDNDAFVGLDRKGWTSQLDNLSESYQFDFELPDPSPLDCHKISFINVSIAFDEATNNLPPSCIGGFWTHALACESNDPLGCPNSTVLYDQQGLNTSFTINEELDNGQNLGVDIVVLINVDDPACTPASISAGLYEADIEICIEVFYEPLDPEMEVDLGDDIIICPGETIDLDGPNGFEAYEWDGPVNSDEQTLEDAIPGTYTLDAYDELGCKSSDVIEILEDGEINIDLGVSNSISLCGGSSIDISPTVNNLTNNPDFDYQWSLPDNSNSNTSSITVSQNGTYMLEVTDSDTDCTQIIELNVIETEISQAQIDSVSLSNVNICEGGTIELTAFVPFDDINNYAFEWVLGTDTTRIQSINADQSGTYILNMYNQLGCPPTSDTIVVEQLIPEIAGQSNNITICSGEELNLFTLLSNDASTNGEWFNDNNDIIENGLFSSMASNNIINITYEVSNALPCIDDIAFFTVFINDESLNAGSDIDLDLCADEMVDLNDIQNGDPGGEFFDESFELLPNTLISSQNLGADDNIFYYILSGTSCGQDTAIINLKILDEIIPTIVNGPYCVSDEIIIGNEVFNESNRTGTVTLNSSNNCDSIVEVDLQFFDIAESTLDETYCSSEVIIIEGEIFNESNNTGTLTLDNGSINGCDSIINVALNFVDAVESFFNQQLCEGETITIGGQIFDETNPSDIITLANGSSLGCDSILNVDLMFTSIISETLLDTICTGEEIEINGEIFNASNTSGEQNFTSALGCDSLLIIELTVFSNSDEQIVRDLCEGDQIEINGEIFDANNLNSEQILINSLGCDSTINITINLIPTITNEISQTLCEGESIVINGEIFDVSNPIGTIVLENESSNNCDSIINIELLFNPNINIDLSNDLCIGDSIFINGEWEFESGTFIETLSTSQGCDSIVSYQVTFSNCEINIIPELITSVSCFGNQDGQIDLSLSGDLNFPYSFELTANNTNIIVDSGQINEENVQLLNLSSTDYTFSLLSSSGDLINTAQFTIAQPEELTVAFVKDDLLCFGDNNGSLNIEVNGGTEPYEYIWDNGSTEPSVTSLTSGSYSYTVTDTNECEIQGSISIIEPSNITANIVVTNADCEDSPSGTIDIMDIQGGTPLYQYSIDGYDYTTFNVFEDLTVGNYQVFISDSNGCIEDFNTQIGFDSTNTIDELNDLNITLGDSVSIALNLNFTPAAINWLNSETISCSDCLVPIFYPTETTTYNVEVEDESGCIILRSFTIIVNIPDNSQVFIPNIFTPGNQSGNNNIFKPFFSQDANVNFLSLEIFDRWGNLIFTESNILNGWDGRSKNRSINQGVYVYKVNYIDGNGNPQIIVGDVTLLR